MDSSPPPGSAGPAEKAEPPPDEAEPGAEEAAAPSQPEAEAPVAEAEAAAEKPPAPPPVRDVTYWDLIRDNYLQFDRRTLGFSRILFGFLLVMDLLRRTWSWKDMYSTEGVLPNHVNLWRPQAYGAWSLFNAFSSPTELWVLWGVMMATFLCVLVGYKTKVAQILTVIFVTSMDGRVLLIENGGYVVYNLLAMWTAFLPMGDRYSVDALLESMKRRRERTAEELNDRTDLIPARKLSPYITVLGIIYLIQLSAIYYFNVLHKTGPAWKNGTAVHYVLYVDRMVTPIVGHVRTHLPKFVLLFMTKSTLAMEAAVPVCLLSPLGRVWARRLAVAMINALHLGFGTAMVLGPFAWACCVFSTLAFGREDWEVANRTMRREHRARTVVYDRGSGAALFFCRLLVRLDRWELLRFRAEDDVRYGLRVEGGSEPRERALGLADIVAALPLGPCLAWILRVPGPRHLVDWIFARYDGRVSRAFGASATPPPARPSPAAPSPLRRRFGMAVFVLGQLGAVAMFAGAVNQALVELWVVNRRIKVPQPEALRLLSHKLRFLQGWFMFSPNPVMDDGTIVVDALTVDGRHIDPFTHQPPRFEIADAKSFEHNQIWCDYFNRIHLPANNAYREAMKDYMYRLPQRTGHPEDAIVSGEVYWVQDMNPKWGDTKSWKYEKVKLFSFENTGKRDGGAQGAGNNAPGSLPSLRPPVERRGAPAETASPAPPPADEARAPNKDDNRTRSLAGE